MAPRTEALAKTIAVRLLAEAIIDVLSSPAART
jgi:hypothetical protein